MSYSKGKTYFEMTFDQTVTVTKVFYKPFSFPDFFASVGGSLGLWLGVGVLQMGESIVKFMTNVSSKLCIKRLNKSSL